MPPSFINAKDSQIIPAVLRINIDGAPNGPVSPLQAAPPPCLLNQFWLYQRICPPLCQLVGKKNLFYLPVQFTGKRLHVRCKQQDRPLPSRRPALCVFQISVPPVYKRSGKIHHCFSEVIVVEYKKVRAFFRCTPLPAYLLKVYDIGGQNVC